MTVGTSMGVTRTSFPVLGGFGVERFKELGVERTINMYWVDQNSPNFPETSKSAGLVKWPGYLSVKEISGKTNGRASFVNKVNPTEAYIVIEDTVYKINFSLTLTAIGTLGTTTGHVGIDMNQTQVIFVDGTGGWTYTFGSSTWASISDPQFPSNPVSVVSIDGYAIVADGDDNTFHFSANADFTTWDGAFASMTTRPDKIKGVATIDRMLYAFGDQSTEVWYDAGIAEFTNSVPFRRYSTVLPPYGLESVDSIAEGFGMIMFLAKDEFGTSQVIMAKGTDFKVVSNPSIEYALEALTTVGDARGDLYKIDGNIFYQLSLTSGDQTFVYHVNKNIWYELQRSDGTRHKMQTYFFFNDKNYFLGYDDNKIYDFSNSYYDNDGDPIRCERITRTLSYENGNKIQLNRVHATFAQGVGNNTNENTYDPYVFLQISRDNGNTYGYHLRNLIGSGGNYDYKTEWVEPFGASETFTFKITYFAKTKFVLTGMYVDIEVMEQ